MTPPGMSRLLDLPDELRLRIYQFAVSDPWPVLVIAHSSCTPGRLETARHIGEVDGRLRDDVLPLFWSANTFSMYHAVDPDTPHNGEHFCQWLECTVQDDAKYVRRLEFNVTARCERRKLALENPKEPGIWYRSDAPNCTTTIGVDLSRPMADAVTVDEEDGCSHEGQIRDRLQHTLSRVPRVNRQAQVTKEVLWELFESCNVWGDQHSGYIPYG